MQAGLVLIAVGRYRVPPAVAARMAANVLLDVAVGSIPVLGDLFDVAFKANTRNMAILEPFLHARGEEVSPRKSPFAPVIAVTPSATSWGCLLAIAVALLGCLALVLIGFLTVVKWLFRPS